MNDIVTLTNTPKTFTINGKDYKVRQFNLFELADIQQYSIECLTKQYTSRLVELANSIGLEQKDKHKFILDAAKKYSPDEKDIKEHMLSKDGIVKILTLALHESNDKVVEILQRGDLMDTTLDIFNHVLGVTVEQTDNNTEKKV